MIYIRKSSLSFFFLLVLITFFITPQVVASPEGGAKPLSNPPTNVSQSRLSVQEPEGFVDYYNNSYANKANNKALYLAVDGLDYDGWAAGHASNYNTLAEAKERALDECEGSRLEWNIISSCVLYAENDRVVYYDDFNDNTPSTQLPAGINDWYLSDYINSSNDKAMYIAFDPSGAWAGGMGYGHSTLANAKSAALAQCESGRIKWSISAPCVLYAENDQIVYSGDIVDDVVKEDATINDDLDIYIPSIDLDGSDIWVDFTYSHVINGNYYWTLAGAGASTLNSKNGIVSTTTLQINLYSLIYAGSYDFWLILDYAYEKAGIYYWTLNSIGPNN